jgi:uncharacterized protein YndB with AHSA1/START domain
MTSTIITPDQDAIISEIQIAAPPERVFEALTQSDQLARWWTTPECPLEFFEMDARGGGRWHFKTKPSATVTVNGMNEFEAIGEVLEFDPPRLLAYTWIANWHEDKLRRTVVRWELTPAGGGTKVKVTHSGLGQEPAARKDYSGGWSGVVELLKKFVEKNK